MRPVPVIMDVDPGVDDMAAMLLAFASPELSVLGVTTVAGNVPLEATTANACKVLGLASREDVPVFAGAARPLVRDQVFGKHADLGIFPDHVVPPTTAMARSRHAVDFIIGTAVTAAADDAPITLCASGPLTNIALALVQDERVRLGIERVVIMGGAFTALGNRRPWAEFNMLADPHAAYIVLHSGVPITLFPLDVTFQALVTSDHLTRLREGAGRAGRALADLFEASDRNDPARFGRPGGPIHDIMPVAWIIAPDLFETQPAEIGIETSGLTQGHTYADFLRHHSRQGNADVARKVDAEGLLSLFLTRMEIFAASDAGVLETGS